MGRAAASIALTLAALAFFASGCGGSGHGAETDPEKGSDAAILNSALTRELTLRDAYAQGRRFARGPRRAGLVRRLRAEEGEFADDLTKAIRGLGASEAEAEAEAEAVDLSKARGWTGFRAVAAELEAEAREFYVDEASHLYTPAPRTLDAWLAAGHGQHLGALGPVGG